MGSIQNRQKPRHRFAAPGQAIDLDVLVQRVRSRVLMSSMSIGLRALSRMAEQAAPEDGTTPGAPEWLRRPVVARLKRAMALRPVTKPPSGRESSGIGMLQNI